MQLRLGSWTRGALVFLAVVKTILAHDQPTLCDTYSVELQAVFESDAAVPCTNEEIAIIEALIHSLVQTDAIVGLNRRLLVTPFYLAFEKFGPGIQQLTSIEEGHFMYTQMQLALPFLTVQDQLEDLYYQSNSDERDSTDDTNDNSPQIEPSKPALDSLVSPPPLELADDSLRTGGGTRTRKLLAPTTSKTVMRGLEAMSESTTASPSSPSRPSPTRFPTTDVSDSSIPPATPSSSPSPSSSSHSIVTPSPGGGDDGGLSCAADWCVFFLTRPCDAIPRDPEEESTERYQKELRRFQRRVAEQIERKLRKWARDTNAMCLGNSWELKASVQRMF